MIVLARPVQRLVPDFDRLFRPASSPGKIFSICFINYLMKDPQITFVPTFLAHIIARIDGVLCHRTMKELFSQCPKKFLCTDLLETIVGIKEVSNQEIIDCNVVYWNVDSSQPLFDWYAHNLGTLRVFSNKSDKPISWNAFKSGLETLKKAQNFHRTAVKVLAQKSQL